MHNMFSVDSKLLAYMANWKSSHCGHKCIIINVFRTC